MVRGTARAVGDRVERFAESFLREHGLQTIARNYRCRRGEIDLIMMDGSCLVFVEVRFRSANRLSSARSTVDANKQRKLVRTAAMYLSSNRSYASYIMRFDVVGVDRNRDGSARVQWIQDAFRPTESFL